MCRTQKFRRREVAGIDGRERHAFERKLQTGGEVLRGIGNAADVSPEKVELAV